ncbi:imidazolonepropionase-like amidohydrolase [Terracoccus luteus]|uniref:Imidazolonepropionase-like amidohydrolase n=1 Tax=Terracoccus luteus TaxID=53356 RepID=A0A495Y1V0_9MICO|nr:amidohydrolase family protein [Terracoccus luteus]RKT78936.1 imidazolonepropionase-like amidohydrolase [Terracoccus luteus]
MTPPTLLTNARVVDVEAGTTSPASVLLDGGRIAAVTPEGAAGTATDATPPGTRVLDLGGRVLAPGFVTVHMHLSIVFPFSDTDEDEDPMLTAFRAATRAREALDAGVTTVRCVHEQHRVDIALREADRRGWFTAPRILAGGRALSAPGGHGQGSGSVYCTGPDEFEAAARAELEAGADHVKIFITGGLAHAGERPEDPEMTDAEMRAVVRAADDHGTYVVAHAGHHEAIRRALDAGVRSFEHAYVVDEPTARLLARPGVFVSPTLAVTRSQDWMAEHGFEAHSRENAARASVEHLASARRLAAAGVALTNGTDLPPGDRTEGTTAVVREAELLVEAGLTPAGALAASTLVPARMCGVDAETGRVAAGLAADLVVLDDDPCADVAALRTVRAVVSRGRVVRDDLGLFDHTTTDARGTT